MRWGLGLGLAAVVSACGVFGGDTASLETMIDPGAADVVAVQVGDYSCCDIDGFLSGPWLVVYADGSFARERMIGVEGGAAVHETLLGQLDADGFREVADAANDLPGSKSVGPDSQAEDGVPTMLYAGDATWMLHMLKDPYGGFVGEVEAVLDRYENEPWIPPAWVEHSPGTTTCMVTADRAAPSLSDAPIYPHMVELYPLGEFECRLPVAMPTLTDAA